MATFGCNPIHRVVITGFFIRSSEQIRVLHLEFTTLPGFHDDENTPSHASKTMFSPYSVWLFLLLAYFYSHSHQRTLPSFPIYTLSQFHPPRQPPNNSSMVLPSLLASPSSVAAANSPTSRMRRGTGRGSVMNTTTIPLSRPPVLLQIMESTILAGIVTEAAPKRVFPYSKDKTKKQESVSSSSPSQQQRQNQSAEDLYRFWAPLLQQVYDNLGQDTKDRNAVVLLPDATLEQEYIHANTKESILRVLLDVIGVPSVHVQPALQFLPFAFPMISTMTIVHLSKTTACTFIHSQGQSLPYTFQSVPLDEGSTMWDEISTGWNRKLQRRYLDVTHPHSVLVALLKTVEDCPLPVRGDAIRNVVFAGEGVLYRPDLPIRITRRLKRILQHGGERVVDDDDDDDDDDEGQNETLEHETTTTTTSSMVPIALSNLKPLASMVGLIDTGATIGPYRPDLLVWIGATLWTSHNHQHNPDAFSWITNKKKEMEE